MAQNHSHITGNDLRADDPGLLIYWKANNWVGHNPYDAPTTGAAIPPLQSSRIVLAQGMGQINICTLLLIVRAQTKKAIGQFCRRGPTLQSAQWLMRHTRANSFFPVYQGNSSIHILEHLSETVGH